MTRRRPTVSCTLKLMRLSLAWLVGRMLVVFFGIQSAGNSLSFIIYLQLCFRITIIDLQREK